MPIGSIENVCMAVAGSNQANPNDVDDQISIQRRRIQDWLIEETKKYSMDRRR